jgi:hypothetical protein
MGRREGGGEGEFNPSPIDPGNMFGLTDARMTHG